MGRWVPVAGLAMVLGGALSLAMPLRLDAADHDGRPLACGSGWHAQDATVQAEDQLNALRHAQDPDRYHLSNYTAECSQWITAKRWAALGAAGSGSAMLAVPFLLGLRTDRHRLRITTASRTVPRDGTFRAPMDTRT